MDGYKNYNGANINNLNDIKADIINTNDINAEIINTNDINAEIINTNDINAEIINTNELYINGVVVDPINNNDKVVGITYNSSTDTTNIDNNLIVTKTTQIKDLVLDSDGSILCNSRTITPVELSYIDGLRSNCQSQLDDKFQNLTIGNVTTLEPGSECTATIDSLVLTLPGGNPLLVNQLNLGLTKGEKGDQGNRGSKGETGDSTLVAILMAAEATAAATSSGFAAASASSASSAAASASSAAASASSINDVYQTRISTLEQKTDFMITSTTNPLTQETAFVGCDLRITKDNQDILLSEGEIFAKNITASNNLTSETVNVQNLTVYGNGTTDLTYTKILPLNIKNDASHTNYILKCTDTIHDAVYDTLIFEVISKNLGINAWTNFVCNYDFSCIGDDINLGVDDGVIISTTRIRGNLLLNNVDITTVPTRLNTIDVDITALKNKTTWISDVDLGANAGIGSNTFIRGNLYLNTVNITTVPTRLDTIDVDITALKNKTVNINIVNGNTSIGSLTVNANGSITINGNLDMTGNLTISGNLNVNGNLGINGNANITNGVLQTEDLSCTDLICNTMSCLGNVEIFGNLKVFGTTFITNLDDINTQNVEALNIGDTIFNQVPGNFNN